MPALLHWPFFYWWGEGCNLSSSSGEISVSFEADERFWVTATLCQSSLIWLLRPADYNLISGALKINLCRAFCTRGCVGAGSLIIHVYFFGPVKLLLCLNQVPTSISHDEAGSDGGVGCRSIKNPQLFSSKLRISQLLNLVPEFCFCVLTLYWGGKGMVWKDQVRSHLRGAVYAGHGPHACNSWGSRRRRSVSSTHKTLSGTARVWDVDQGRTSLLCAVLWIRCT